MTELEKAAFEQEFDKLWFGNLEEYFNHDAVDYANIRNTALHFVNWQKEQFEKVENYQEEGWYSSGDDEYVYGISFDEPIRLPVEFYIKKK